VRDKGEGTKGEVINGVVAGKAFSWAKMADVANSVATLKYYAGWADKITGQLLEVDENKMAFTRSVLIWATICHWSH
jgi:acyl-CoA reductase-like NAD-dependent aldehyde dehydrogenase